MRTPLNIRSIARVARAVALGAVAVAGLSLGAASRAGAQALGPQRQFLSLEPYYSRLMLDNGDGSTRTGVNGYGGRLWVNLAPFSGPSPNLLGHMSLALFTTYYPDQANNGASLLNYGAESDIFFVNRPLGGVLDPFISIGGSAFRTKDTNTDESQTRFALSPGAGIRIPLSNRFQIRGDAKDVLLFGVPVTSGKKTLNNYEFSAALGITF